MSTNTKALLAAAAGEASQGDQSWHAESTRRLYFQHPTDVDAAGMVDVNDRGGREPTHVRVELWISPEIACEIIAHVTGRADLAARVLVRREIVRIEAERASREDAKPTVHGDGLDIPASALRIEKEDDERSSKLTDEIKATGGLEFGTEEDEAEELAQQKIRDEKRAARKAEIAALEAEQKADEEDAS
jgi:hypothetical protein